jgi:catechol 2,3-dioxygenase-like lactoylglutathione lyase family enzyme
LKIDHFAFEISDLRASIDFYTNQLGFQLQYMFTDENEHETLAILALDGGKLELIQVLSNANEPKLFEPQFVRPHFCPHLALESDDFEKTLAHIHANGLEIIHGPLEIPGLAKWLYICDPDNNVIEFFQEFHPASESNDKPNL